MGCCCCSSGYLNIARAVRQPLVRPTSRGTSPPLGKKSQQQTLTTCLHPHARRLLCDFEYESAQEQVDATTTTAKTTAMVITTGKRQWR